MTHTPDSAEYVAVRSRLLLVVGLALLGILETFDAKIGPAEPSSILGLLVLIGPGALLGTVAAVRRRAEARAAGSPTSAFESLARAVLLFVLVFGISWVARNFLRVNPFLAEPVRGATVRQWVKAFGSSDRDKRHSAIAVLEDVTWGVHSKAKTPELRRNADEMLAMIREALVPALDDQDKWIRERSAITLGKMYKHGAPAVPALEKALEHPDAEMRDMVLSALGSIGPHAALAAASIGKALKDPVDRVCDTATSTLGKIGPGASAAIPALIEALGRKDMGLPAAMAFERIGEQAVPALKEKLPAAKFPQRLWVALSLRYLLKERIDAEVLPIYRDALKLPDASLRGAAADCLRSMKAAAAPAVPELIALLSDPDDRVAGTAAAALGDIGPASRAPLEAALPGLTGAAEMQARLALKWAGSN